MTVAAATVRRLVSVERPADLTTPVALMRALLHRPDPCFLLESVEGGERVGRWSFLGSAPRAEIPRAGEDPFAALKTLPRLAEEAGDDDPPFTGGAVGYVGYDAARHLERLPDLRLDPIGLPDGWFGLFDDVIAFDHVKHRLLFVTHAENGGEGEAEARLAGFADALLAANVPPDRPGPPPDMAWTETLPRAEFAGAVERAREYIRAGDIFQVVLSRRWSAPFAGDPFAVYRALRRISPFASGGRARPRRWRRSRSRGRGGAGGRATRTSPSNGSSLPTPRSGPST
jgi:anthranilate synthase component 1